MTSMPFDEPSYDAPAASWRHSLLAAPVWKRAACYGLPAGLLQAALNQGDFWATGAVTAVVAVKSVLSPLIGFGVAYVAAVTTHYETRRALPRSQEFANAASGHSHGFS
jgi:hypothetical protein